MHAAEYDGLGRRIEKGVSNFGDLDGTFRYGYIGQQMIERRDGSSNVLTQAYYGTQYIDEIVALKLEHGYAVVSQDANYNVTTLTDLAGRVLERVFTTEYGQPILESDSYFGDYDADGDVDSTDDGFLGSGQTCWGANPSGACRVFDFNSDGTLDASDETVMTALVAAPTTNRIHHARRTSPAGNLFLHQGLLYDAEIGAYQNRAREYDSSNQRFLQRDPLYVGHFLGATASVEQLHLYGYLNGQPLKHNDPSGLSGSCDDDCYDHWRKNRMDCANRPICSNFHTCIASADQALGVCVGNNASGCGNSPPLQAAGNCNYPPSYRYAGVSAQCMCKCMGDDPWSQRVRACLRCYYMKGCSPDQSHQNCYRIADNTTNRPDLKLIRCAIKCFFE